MYKNKIIIKMTNKYIYIYIYIKKNIQKYKYINIQTNKNRITIYKLIKIE